MAPEKPTLGTICAVTYAVPDLGAIKDAYCGELGYRVAARERVREDQARAWAAPRAAGRNMLVLAPESGEPVFLRFIEAPYARGWQALKTFGWNATEFVVQDVEALARRVGNGHAFKIIGEPRGLTRFPMIRAMQVIGPAGECCYFTQVGEGSGLDLAEARSFVGRVFIVVAAGPDADVLFAPYAMFANAHDAPVATPVRVISAAHDLPEDTLHRHGLVRLSRGTLIELDAYPASATQRAAPEGELLPGMAMVSFEVEELPAVPFIAASARAQLPGDACEAACLRGAAGEWIELVARGESK